MNELLHHLTAFLWLVYLTPAIITSLLTWRITSWYFRHKMKRLTKHFENQNKA